MKKIKLLIIMLLLIPFISSAQQERYATVFSPVDGDRKIVTIGDQFAFNNGYVLETKDINFISYWRTKIDNGELGEDYLGKLPKEYIDKVIPKIIRIIPKEGALGSSEETITTCLGSECDKYNFEPEEGMLGYSVVTDYSTTLSSSMTSTQTTVPVSSVTTKDDHTLTMADLGDKVFLMIEPGASKQEIVMATGISGTNWTGATRGLSFYGTSTAAVAGNRKTHNSGSTVTMSNVHYVYDELVDKDATETISGVKTFSSIPLIPTTAPTLESQVASKYYVDSRNGYWEQTSADFASLPTGVNDGEARVTTDDGKIYTWDSTTSTWIIAGGGGGAGTIYQDFQLGSDCTGRTCTMSAGSWNDLTYLSVYLNGIILERGDSADFTASSTGATILFNYDIDDEDKVLIRVDSIDYYNPNWDEVNDDLAPSLTNTYDLGTSTKQWKDLYLYGDANIGGTLDVTGTTTLATTSSTGIILNGTSVTADADELNKLDGTSANVTSTNLNELTDGSTATVLHTHPIAMGSISTSTISSHTQVVTHNLGVTPQILKISAVYADNNTVVGIRSDGYYDGTNQATIYTYKSGNPQYGSGLNTADDRIIVIDSSDDSGRDDVLVTASALNSTTFTLTWTVTTSRALGLIWEVQ